MSQTKSDKISQHFMLILLSSDFVLILLSSVEKLMNGWVNELMIEEMNVLFIQ